MKFLHAFFLILIIALICNHIASKSKKSHLKKNKFNKKQIIHDTTNFGSNVNTVIRKTPNVYYHNKFAYPELSSSPSNIYFGNSNTSSLPNPGGFSVTAQQINPSIIFHSKEPISVVENMPVHLGYKNRINEITSFDKQTGKVEKHEINDKIPLYGNVQHVRNLIHETIKPLDLQTRRFGKSISVVHENPELDYNSFNDARFNFK